MDKKTQIYYDTALDKLRPLRFYVHELLELIDRHNRFAEQFEEDYMIDSKYIEEARKASQDAEDFFSKKR